MGGALIKNKSSFNLNVYGINAYDTPNLNVALPNGTQAQALGAPIAARQPVRQRPGGLRADARSDAALRLQPDPVHATATSASAATTSRSARTRPRTTLHNLRGAALRTDRPPRVLAFAAAVLLVRLRHASRRPRPRRFASTTPSPAAARSSPAAQHRETLQPRRPIWTTCAAGTRCARGVALDGGWYRSDASSNYLGTYTFDSLDGLSGAAAEQLHAAHRRSEHLVPESSGRRSTCRTTSG